MMENAEDEDRLTLPALELCTDGMDDALWILMMEKAEADDWLTLPVLDALEEDCPHAPTVTVRTPSTPAKQALPYVFPSHPQTAR